MAAGWIEQKRRYRQYKARTERLPASYRTVIDALVRYTHYFGPGTGEGVLSMLENLADLFEQSAASGTPVRAVVAEDPWSSPRSFSGTTRRVSGTTRRVRGSSGSGNG